MMYGNILFLLVIGVVIYMMMKKGGGCCGGHDHGGHDSSGSNKDADHAHHMEIETPEKGTYNDPVCGMEVRDHSIVSRHLGKTFHFCSEQCRKIFDLNPTKFSGA